MFKPEDAKNQSNITQEALQDKINPQAEWWIMSKITPYKLWWEWSWIDQTRGGNKLGGEYKVTLLKKPVPKITYVKCERKRCSWRRNNF